MSKYIPVKNFSDRTPKARLVEVSDIVILESRAEVERYPENQNKKIEEIEAKIAAEKATKYPCAEYIARCEQKILAIKQNIAIYNMRRRK